MFAHLHMEDWVRKLFRRTRVIRELVLPGNQGINIKTGLERNIFRLSGVPNISLLCLHSSTGRVAHL